MKKVTAKLNLFYGILLIIKISLFINLKLKLDCVILIVSVYYSNGYLKL